MSRKLAKNQKKKENPAIEITGSILEYALAFFLGVICFWLPLYMADGYFKIGTAKFSAYAHIVVFGLPLILALALLYQIFVWRENGGLRQLKTLPKRMVITDWFVIAFLTVAILSFLLSGNQEQAFWGYDGWFMGLFFQISIAVIYFLTATHGKYGKGILALLCGVAFLTFCFGILHRLLIDPLGVYANISDYYKTQFLSTLGQASWYSSFVCSVLPVGLCCFFLAKKTWLRIVSGIFSFVGFMTLVTQNSDSAYIAFAMMLLVLFFFAVKSADGMLRLLEILLLFFAAPKVMQLLLAIHPNETLDLDTLSTMLVFGWMPYVMLLVTALLWVGMFFFKKQDCYPQKGMRIFSRLFYAAVILGVIFAVMILLLGARGILPAPLQALAGKVPYLTWDATWGNGRGFTWTATAKIISGFSPLHLLIGVGPDCYAHYAYTYYADYLNSMWGNNVLTNAHNEWLNMVVNYGLIGAAAYLGIFVSALTAFLRHADKSPLLVTGAACIAAYMGHNLFCYQQVLCTPFVFMIMAFGIFELRRKEE